MKAEPVPFMPNRRALAQNALHASIAARLKAGKDLHSPVCIYGIAEAHGLKVTFRDIDMEGMYQRGSPPRIHLPSRRPLARRAYSCAHELGHHLLGHGSSIDELRENQQVRPWDIPEEYSADTFAGFVLMPTLGLRQAFASRNLDPATARPINIYRIACNFGVGYRTLITHLLWGERWIGHDRAEELRRHTPQSLRAQILGQISSKPLIVIDQAWTSPSIDCEVGHLLLLPADVAVHGAAIERIATLDAGALYEARKPGIAQVTRPGTEWAAFARIAREEYAGRAEFRHLQEEEGDDD